MPVYVGTILSTDNFYYDDPDTLKQWQKLGILATEMESAALYFNAMRAGKMLFAYVQYLIVLF